MCFSIFIVKGRILRQHFSFLYLHFSYVIMMKSGPGSPVQRLVTGRSVRGSNPGGGEISRTCPDRPWGPPSLLYNGYRVFPGGKERPGRDTDPSPPSSAVGYERVQLYLYSPYGPYGLYRASVPVQGCTLPSICTVDCICLLTITSQKTQFAIYSAQHMFLRLHLLIIPFFQKQIHTPCNMCGIFHYIY